MGIRSIVFVALVGCAQPDVDSAASQRADSPVGGDRWSVKEVRNASDSAVPGHAASVITFASGDSLKVPLRDVEVLARLVDTDSIPSLLLAGVSCSECDLPIQVFRFKANSREVAPGTDGYPFPGEQTEAGDVARPHLRSQLFVGRCGQQHDVAVWIYSARDSTDRWQRGVLVLQASGDLARSAGTDADSASLLMQRSVKAGACREIPGRPQFIS